MKLENKKVSELEDDKIYVFKRSGGTGQLKGITLKGIYRPETEMLVIEAKERKISKWK